MNCTIYGTPLFDEKEERLDKFKISNEHGLVVRPDAVAVGALDDEAVLAGLQLAEGNGRLLTNIVPLLAVIHAVGIAHQVVVVIVQCRKVDGQVALVLLYRQRLAVQDGVLLLLALIAQTGKDNVGLVVALLGLLDVEGQHASQGSCPQMVVLAEGGECLRQFCRHIHAGRSEGQQAVCLAVVHVYFRLAHNPYIALSVFLQRQRASGATVHGGCRL